MSHRPIHALPLLALRTQLRALLAAGTVAILTGTGTASAPPDTFPEIVLECASCHRGGDRDQVGEWLASPYSASEGGLGCVACHSWPCRGDLGAGGAVRTAPSTGLDALRAAARLTVLVDCTGDVVAAEVLVANVGVGHLLPTGPAGRRLVLEVAARGPDGGRLPLNAGPRRAPRAGGRPDVAGKVFSSRPLSAGPSTRDPPLAPFATDVSRYRFAVPDGMPAMVTARLVLVPLGGDPVEITSTTSSCQDNGMMP